MNISDKSFLTTIALFVVIAILSTAYIFLVRKEYAFIIEAPCDPATSICFSRDCTVDECPPDGLESYRIFSVTAKDFATCSDGSCLQECLGATIACTETLCGESEDDVCTELFDQ